MAISVSPYPSRDHESRSYSFSNCAICRRMKPPNSGTANEYFPCRFL
jgi:hypothetical protein